MLMKRIPAIDIFRGISVVLMVFFSLMAKLSNSLPYLLKHGIPREFYVGDMVLPMFLFASGISIYFFVNKRKGNKWPLLLDSIGRLGKFFLVSALLSIFSAGQFLGMDEIMLNAILFLLALMLINIPSFWYLFISISIFFSYLFIQTIGIINIFDSAYLGGYNGAIFYLPVMLSGLAIARYINKNELLEMNGIKKFLVIVIVLFLLFLFLTPLDKSRVSPSFMLVSILASSIIFVTIMRNNKQYSNILQVFEYLGQRSLRYWVLMFIFFIIPHGFCFIAKACPLAFSFSWPEAIIISLLFLVLFAVISHIMDNLAKKLRFNIFI